MDFYDIDTDGMAKIKVFGVGGGGGNAVNNMISSVIQGVTFVVANTDLQALNRSRAEFKIQLGDKLTKGLGAGANPDIGRDAAYESLDLIREHVEGCDMVFVTAGMGGGTGTGAAPVIAQVAKESGALTVGVVTKPFYFEGKKRRDSAERGIAEFRQYVDSLISIPNDRLLALAAKKATFIDMLKKADEVLYYAVKGISDLIMVPGLINLDFADVKAVMSEMGLAMMGTGIARGESRAREAAMKAITSPLLEDVSIDGALGVLMNITCGPDLSTEEVSEAMNTIYEVAHEDAKIYFGAVFDDDIGDEIRITVIATGIESAKSEAVPERDMGKVMPFARRGKQGVRSAAPVAGAAGPSPFQNPAVAPTPPASAPLPARSRPYAQARGAGGDDSLDIPAYIRKKRPEETRPQAAPVKAHAPGEEDFIFDDQDFEIPSFIRRQAD